MNCLKQYLVWRKSIALFVSLLMVGGVVGCGNDPGSAMPVSGIKRDAGAKKDSSSSSAGAGGTTIAGGTGGNGGTISTVGSGGSIASSSDAAAPPDAAPDLVPDSARDTRIPNDVFEVSIALDTSTEASPDLMVDSQEAPRPDTASEGLRDSGLDGHDSFADLVPDSQVDLAPDLADVATNGDLGPDLLGLPDVGPDLSPDDAGPDTPPAPTCPNPGWVRKVALSTPSPGWLSGDKEGNLFLANTLFGSADLGGDVNTITSAGNSDILIAHFDHATGDAVWAKPLGDGAAQTAASVAVDGSGHVGFVGGYRGSMKLGPSQFSNSESWSNGIIGALAAVDGTALGGMSVALRDANTLTSLNAPKLVAIGANPNIDGFVVCGYASILATDLVTNPTDTAGGGYDIVVAKVVVSSSGLTVSWGRQFGGAGNQKCTAATIGDDGNIVIAGSYSGQLDFGGGAFSPASAASVVLPWIARLNKADGSLLAATNVPPGNVPPGVTGATVAFVQGVDTDSAGNIAVMGYFFNALTFGATTITSADPTGVQDAFAAKFSSSPLTPVWAMNWGNPSNPDTQNGKGIAFDSSGNLTVVGAFNTTIKIGPGGGILTAASAADPATGLNTNNTDVFFARLSGADGSSRCAARFGDYGSQEADGLFIARSATGTAKDVVFVSGMLTSVLDFGTASLSTVGSATASYWLARF